jgi:predicted nucleic acid-binding protein
MEFDMSGLLYLDYNCFQRSFDDQKQVRIRLEAVACEAIFAEAEQGKVELAWSFMHQDENAVCPYLNRKSEVLRLSELCEVKIAPDPKIKKLALELQALKRLGAKDALHVACAVHCHADMFVTCDDVLERKCGEKIGNLVIMNPTKYVLMEK